MTSRRDLASGANATTRLIGTSFLAGLLLTVAQLGLGGGLGLLDWQTPAGYGSALAWVAFIFTTATLGGVYVARRRVAGAQGALGARPGLPARSGPLRVVLRRAFVAVAAGAGALVALPLVWLPVRAGVAGVDNPAGTVIGCAAGGVVVGVVFAVAALAAGPVAAGVAGSVLWLWVAALASVTLAVVKGGPTDARLGVIEAPSADWWSGPYPMIGLYLTLALTVALIASRLGAPRRQIALSGLVGPALLASAYAVAGSGAAAGSAVAAGPTVGGSSGDGSAVGDAASAIAGGDVRIAALVAAGVGLLASTVVAIRAVRPAQSPARAWSGVTTTLVDAPAAVTLAQAPPAPGRASGRASARASASTRSTARRTASLDETPKPTKRSKAASASAASTVPSPAAVPTPRKSPERKTSRKRAAQVQPPVAAAARTETTATAESTPAEPRRPLEDNVRLSRREREHVKWMENLLNMPADPTLTTRRKSS